MSDRIKVLLKKLEAMNSEEYGDEQVISPPEKISGRIATLEPGVFKPISPMLRSRFEYAPRWVNARLSQTWLSLSDIENARKNPEIVKSINLRIENWDFVPPGSTPLKECAIFGHNSYESDETYLVWEGEEEEPSIWEFFQADYYYFKNFKNYLEYIAGDREVDDSGRMIAGLPD